MSGSKYHIYTSHIVGRSGTAFRPIGDTDSDRTERQPSPQNAAGGETPESRIHTPLAQLVWFALYRLLFLQLSSSFLHLPIHPLCVYSVSLNFPPPFFFQLYNHIWCPRGFRTTAAVAA